MVAAFSLLAIACRGGGDKEEPTPSPSPVATATPKPPTPTPETESSAQLEPPLNAADARIRLEPLIAGGRDQCPAEIADSWAATCAFGDIDGDGETDIAVLVPLPRITELPPNPGMVLVARSGSGGTVDQFGQDGSVDGSILGVSIFDLIERDGREGAEVSYLRNTCTAAGCTSFVHVQRWDGTAWRDIGPGDDGVLNIESVVIEGEAAATRIVMSGGKSNTRAAGPTRLSTYTYELENGRFSLKSLIPNPPEYLFHAVLEADKAFDAALQATASWDAAIAAYEALIAADTLLDWKDETESRPGRPALEGYALFRIAVATAASGRDPTAALDRTVLESAEPVFVIGAEEFRRGFQEGLGMVRACNQATAYFGTVRDGYDTPGYIANLFNYGYENPRKTYIDLCPL